MSDGSQILAGRYRLREALGGGGTSLVHRAQPLDGGPEVAIKILRPQFASDAALRRRFMREAELARRLEHPSIVRVLDVGESAGVPYLVLELVPGETLRQLLDRQGPLAWPTAGGIFNALAGALDHAHARGVLHRDVKPENIFVSGWMVKLGDFGNARVVSLASVTGASLTWGTPEYVAPEVFTRGRADPRSDFYSLGVVLHEMLTGRLPFSRAETLTRLGAPAGTRPALAATGAGANVERLIADLLSVSPSDRPASGEDAMSRLLSERAPTVRKLVCAGCGAPRADDVPRCVACGREVLRVRHDPKGRWRLVLRSLPDDAAETERLMRVFEPLIVPVTREILFLNGEAALYSPEEQKAGIALPAVLLDSLDESTARALRSLGRGEGLELEVLEGSWTIAIDSPNKLVPKWRVLVPILIAGAALGATVGSLLVGIVASAGIAGLGYASLAYRERKRLRSGAGILMLRSDLGPSPAAEALLSGAARAAEGVRAPEVRALLADAAAELFRLTRAAERLRAANVTGVRTSSELALIERTIAAAPALNERLGRLAARLDALDAALEGASEGELMGTLARLERAAAAPGADREALAATRRDVEATLERRAAAEQERARLAATLCQLLGNVRQLYRRAGGVSGLEALDEVTASGIEAAAAEVEGYLAAATSPGAPARS